MNFPLGTAAPQLGDCCCWLASCNFIKHNGLLLANWMAETDIQKKRNSCSAGKTCLKLIVKLYRKIFSFRMEIRLKVSPLCRRILISTRGTEREREKWLSCQLPWLVFSLRVDRFWKQEIPLKLRHGLLSRRRRPFWFPLFVRPSVAWHWCFLEWVN